MHAAIILVLLHAAFHLGHAHANYRHGPTHGYRGANLYWSSARAHGSPSPGRSGHASAASSDAPADLLRTRRPSRSHVLRAAGYGVEPLVRLTEVHTCLCWARTGLEAARWRR